MSAQTITRALTNDTDANFRLWGKAISDQMAAGGWVQTTDTGQINWATVLTTALTAVQGFEIWRSNDAAGSVIEMYVKIEYGGVASSIPQIHVTVGFGSNGTGTLTGITTTRTAVRANTNTASLVTCNMSVGTGFVSIMMGALATNMFGFSIERLRDSSLNEINTILFQCIAAGGTHTRQVATYLVGVYVATASSIEGGLLPPASANAVQGGVTALGMAFGQGAGWIGPSMNFFGAYLDTAGLTGTTFTMTIYGVSHTYIVNPNVQSFLSSAFRLIQRFE